MEEQWQVDRARLRTLLRAHPDWPYRQYSETIGRSYSWVKKWVKRLKAASSDDDQVLKGRSRRPHHLRPSIAPAVVKRILAIRDEPPDGLQRVPGPLAIKYFLHEAEKTDPLGHHLPTSTSTIWRILDQHQRIWRPTKADYEPLPRANPMLAWQIDFKDVTSVKAEPEGKQGHAIEVLNVIDSGSSVLLANLARADFNQETAIEAMLEIFERWGCPNQITFDRDPRFVGSWSGRDFPTAFIRFLVCLGIEINICPPQRPDKNCFVERYHRTYQQEAIQIYRPGDMAQVIEMNASFAYHYNYQRPNQALTCGNQPPRRAFPTLPALPALPQIIDPDCWLTFIDTQRYVRRVDRAGTFRVDRHRYYLGRADRGRHVVVRVDAAHKQFIAEYNNEVLKQLPIKGLENQLMSLADYCKFIRAEAISDWRRYLRKTGRYV